jgi:hypothetical protein
MLDIVSLKLSKNPLFSVNIKSFQIAVLKKRQRLGLRFAHTERYIRNAPITIIATPNVVAQAFGCSTLQGVELDD